jgi:hypothetical protein
MVSDCVCTGGLTIYTTIYTRKTLMIIEGLVLTLIHYTGFMVILS